MLQSVLKKFGEISIWFYRILFVLGCALVFFFAVKAGMSLKEKWTVKQVTNTSENAFAETEVFRTTGICHCMSVLECSELHGGAKLSDLESCWRGKVCCPPSKDIKNHLNYNLLPRPERCGISKVPLDTRISQGKPVYPGQHPWMALLGVKDAETDRVQWLCGGTLINNRYILTAAHCVDKNFTINAVRLGEVNIDKSAAEDCVGKICVEQEAQDFAVERIVIHERWDDGFSLKNDIALLRLARDVATVPGSDVFPICLPLDENDVPQGPNSVYEVAGWGMTEDSYPLRLNSALLNAYLDKRSIDECNICHFAQSDYCPITETQICAQGLRGADVCKGDSGGPLIAFGVRVSWQVGITSFNNGESCGQEEVPSIFTNVTAFLPWILDNVNP